MSCFNEIEIQDEVCGNREPDSETVVALGKLSKECFPELGGRKYIRAHLQTPEQRLITMRDETRRHIIGFCFLRKIRPEDIFIHTVCINNKFKNQKCCMRLFLFLVQNYGAYNLLLEVRLGRTKVLPGKAANTAACKCYSRFGFVLPDSPTTSRYDLDEGIMMHMVRYNRPVPTRLLKIFDGCEYISVVESANRTTRKNVMNVLGINEIKIGKLFNHYFVWKRQADNTWMWCVELETNPGHSNVS